MLLLLLLLPVAFESIGWLLVGARAIGWGAAAGLLAATEDLAGCSGGGSACSCGCCCCRPATAAWLLAALPSAACAIVAAGAALAGAAAGAKAARCASHWARSCGVTVIKVR